MKRQMHMCVIAAAALAAATASARPMPPLETPVVPLSVAMTMEDMDMGMKGGMGNMKPMEKEKAMRGGSPQGGTTMPADPAAAGSQPAPKAREAMGMPSGMDMMGRAAGPMERRGMPGMGADSSLPGFPGASHLYHVGATGFFLDHPELMNLSKDQQAALNRVREKSALEQATFDRRIDEAEQELWTLTAADTPELAKVDAAVRAVEKLRGDKRLAFIKAVGEAGTVLTSDQRKALLGGAPGTAGAPSAPAPVSHAKPPAKLH